MAVITEHTLAEAMETQGDLMKLAKEEMMRVANELVKVFHKADNDKSGMLSKDEFVDALGNEKSRQLLQELDLGEDFTCMDPEEIGMLFDTIDVDDSQELSAQEFVDGMMQMRGAARARRLFELHCELKRHCNHVRANHTFVTEHLTNLANEVAGIHKSSQDEAVEAQQRHDKLDKLEEKIDSLT